MNNKNENKICCQFRKEKLEKLIVLKQPKNLWKYKARQLCKKFLAEQTEKLPSCKDCWTFLQMARAEIGALDFPGNIISSLFGAVDVTDEVFDMRWRIEIKGKWMDRPEIFYHIDWKRDPNYISDSKEHKTFTLPVDWKDWCDAEGDMFKIDKIYREKLRAEVLEWEHSVHSEGVRAWVGQRELKRNLQIKYKELQ